MAFTNGFERDVFLSYARLDDEGDAWVTRFEAQLTTKMSQIVGTRVDVFRDTRSLDVNQRFDSVIKKTLQESAVLLSIISSGFQKSLDRRQEVRAFYEAAKAGGQLVVGSKEHSRTFNVLRYKIPYEEWLQELSGITELKFYDDQGHFGRPLDPESPEGRTQVDILADQIANTLMLLKANGRGRRESRASSDKMRVFLAPARRAIRFDQNELCNRLSDDDSLIVERGSSTLEKDLIKGFQEADVAVVMVDDRGDTETLQNLELVQVYAGQWILAVDPGVDLSAGRTEYQQRLIGLRDAHRGDSGDRVYKFVHHSKSPLKKIDINDLLEEVLDTLKEVRRRRGSNKLMLDGNECDRDLLREIDTHIAEKHEGVETEWVWDETPASAFRSLDGLLDECRASMVVYGAIEKVWVESRLRVVRQALRIPSNLGKPVSLFYGPPKKHAEEQLQPVIHLIGDAIQPIAVIDYFGQDWKRAVDNFLKAAGF